jgi:hypothetical protein
MRAHDKSTPCGCGVAPPDRPVPEPRATSGTFKATAGGEHRVHLRFRAWKYDYGRKLAVHRQTVAFVRTALLGACQYARLGQHRAQRRDDIRLLHAFILTRARATTPRVACAAGAHRIC